MKDKKVSPFSFFRWIFISPDDHNKQKLDEIITHEQAHVRQLHSIDTIVSELLCILFWWNPFAWLMKKEIKINLEYLADQGVLQAGYDSKEYQYILLQVSNKNTSGPAIISYFNVSRLKKRIAMMNRKDSPALASFKYLLIVPAGIFLLLGNAVQASSEPINISHEVLADVFAPSPTNTEATDVNNTKTGQIKSLAASQADDSKPFITVERMPGYPGGERDLKKFIRTNLKYPADAIKNNIQGRVIVRFIVDETGKIKNAEIVKGIHSSCDAEALRVIKNMPDWIPGKQDGKNVPVYFNMPIQFKMTGKVNNGLNLHTSLKNKNIV
jgi:TonB family protein